MGRLPGGLAPPADWKATPPPYADSRKATVTNADSLTATYRYQAWFPKRFAAGAGSGALSRTARAGLR